MNERRGRPLSVTILEAYRRMIKHGLPSAKERMGRRGVTISHIARVTGTNRMTVYKYVRAMIQQDERNRKPPPPDHEMPDGVP